MFLLLLLVSVASAEECITACQLEFRPVCGSDGTTYSNACQLQALNCLQRTSVYVVRQGDCAEDIVAEEPEPEPECSIFCTLQWEPVCGTNAVTYGNLCQMQYDSCVKRTPVAVQYAGECFEEAAEAPEAECNTACTYQWEPVCGTNAVTYGNLCQMQSDACLKRTAVAVQYAGECVEDVVEAPESETTDCIVACTYQWEPVCGSNAVTYGNLCQMQSDACLKRTAIAVQYAGECAEDVAEEPEAETACNVACTLQWEPVCGTNAVTYGNLCQMQSDACLKRTPVAVQYAGECAEPADELVAADSCNVICQMNWDPVCGSDAVTYGNMCQLNSIACQKRSPIAVAHYGSC